MGKLQATLQRATTGSSCWQRVSLSFWAQCLNAYFRRQVRTLIGAVGLTVLGLKRVRIGGFRLPRTLGFGQFVPLKPNDIRRVLDRGICAQFTGIQ